MRFDVIKSKYKCRQNIYYNSIDFMPKRALDIQQANISTLFQRKKKFF